MRIVRRIADKIKFLHLKSGMMTFADFKRDNDFFQLHQKQIDFNKEKLHPYYEEYIKEVSRADMAASLEMAALLLTLCEIKGYKRLLDTGTGFSSFVFRLYAKQHTAEVFSVDDDQAWLQKSIDFLKRHDVSTKNVIMIDDFLSGSETGFDLALHDMNFVEIRINYVEQILQKMSRGGFMIFDDVHKTEYLFPLLEKLKKLNQIPYDLRPVTLDRFGRYALGVIK
jgi:predicted O-methyltransferase YrrM